MDWYTLKFLPNNKFVKYIGIWLVILPIIHKIINSQIFIDYCSKHGIDIPNLPIKWELFFFAALFFTIANIVYVVFCPEIIKDHISFAGFLGDRKTYLHLEEYKMQIKDIATKVFKSNDEEILRNTFWAIHRNAKFKYIFSRYICIMLYVLGFTFLASGIICGCFDLFIPYLKGLDLLLQYISPQVLQIATKHDVFGCIFQDNMYLL